jgi:hypothetical protein
MARLASDSPEMFMNMGDDMLSDSQLSVPVLASRLVVPRVVGSNLVQGGNPRSDAVRPSHLDSVFQHIPWVFMVASVHRYYTAVRADVRELLELFSAEARRVLRSDDVRLGYLSVSA